jgi:hypothetical protein
MLLNRLSCHTAWQPWLSCEMHAYSWGHVFHSSVHECRPLLRRYSERQPIQFQDYLVQTNCDFVSFSVISWERLQKQMTRLNQLCFGTRGLSNGMWMTQLGPRFWVGHPKLVRFQSVVTFCTLPQATCCDIENSRWNLLTDDSIIKDRL